MMLFRYRRPRAPLSVFIESIWICRNDPRPFALERILPTGAAQLIVNLQEDQIRRYQPDCGHRCDTTSGTVLAGVQSSYGVIDTDEQEYVLGVSFRPGGTLPFVRIPACETQDADVPLDLLWDRRAAATLRERLLECRGLEATLDAMEQVLMEMRRPVEPHPAVAFALDMFARQPCVIRVGAVTDRIGLSPKRFIERFKSEVGLTPKRYCRILRFQQALASAHHGHRVDWAQLALDCGYHDQAHLAHDFRGFSGLSPTEYQVAQTEFRNHVKFLQDEAPGL